MPRRDVLLEREAELRRIDAVLDAAVARRGGALLVEAPAGLGKTRLLDAATERAEPRGMTVLRARAVAIESSIPYGLVRRLMAPVVRSRERARLLAGAARLAEAILVPSEEARRATGEPPAPGSELYGLYWLVSNLCERGPLLLAVDDLHWCDTASQRFLVSVTAQLRDLPCALVLAARPAEGAGDESLVALIATDPDVEVLRPRPLSEAASGQLVRQRLGEEVHPGFATACHEVTAGNPFFLEELLAELRRAGTAPDEEHARRVRDIGPRAVSRTVFLRLAELTEGAPRLARALAILGDGAELRHAGALADLDATRAGEACDALARVSIVHRRDRLSFVHPIVGRAIYEDIAPRERARRHRSAAALLARDGADPVRVSAHLLHTEPADDPEVVAILRAAARAAVGQGAAVEATAYLRRALRERAGAARGDLLWELGSAEALAGLPEAVEHLAAAAEAVDDPGAQAQIAATRASMAMFAGRTSDAIAVLQSALAKLGDRDRELALRLEADLLTAKRVHPSHWRAAAERLEALHGEGLGGDTAGERRMLALRAGDMAARGQPAARCVEVSERALRGGRLLEEVGPESPLYYLALLPLFFSGELERDEGYIDEALAVARSRGSAVGFVSASFTRAWLLFRRGDLREAEADGRLALDTAVSRGIAFALPSAASGLVDALVERGDLAQAEQVLALVPGDGPVAESANFDVYLASRARLHAASGRHPEALTDLLECGRLGERLGLLNPARSHWRALAALTALRLGDRDRARELAAAELELAEAFGPAYGVGVALAARGVCEGGARGVTMLRESVEALESVGARLEQARALAELGAALRRRGDPQAAREPLRRSLDLASRAGAALVAERARRELVAAGARPRADVLTGVDSLTASERRIAALAAEGRSNREIAQDLFLTVRTVETHLTHAYRKLGIGSRSELPAELRRSPE